jgi:hypothetical protein
MLKTDKTNCSLTNTHAHLENEQSLIIEELRCLPACISSTSCSSQWELLLSWKMDTGNANHEDIAASVSGGTTISEVGGRKGDMKTCWRNRSSSFLCCSSWSLRTLLLQYEIMKRLLIWAWLLMKPNVQDENLFIFNFNSDCNLIYFDHSKLYIMFFLWLWLDGCN